MSGTSLFKVFVDGVKVKTFHLKRGQSKYVSTPAVILCICVKKLLYLPLHIMQDHPWIP